MIDLPAQGFVKICGVTNVADARSVALAKADALGMIFADAPREVTIADAREIVEETAGALLHAGVFRGRDDATILATIDKIDFGVVQLHDAPSDALLKELDARELVVIRALDIESDEFTTFDETTVDVILVDGSRPGSGEHIRGRD